ncbi:hypothetical protein QTP88_002477 [Uroleucon formosanum]
MQRMQQPEDRKAASGRVWRLAFAEGPQSAGRFGLESHSWLADGGARRTHRWRQDESFEVTVKLIGG